MAVTKTKFINYIRCPRYVALDKIKKDFMASKMTLEEYLKEEQEEHISEMLKGMYDEEEVDLIDVKDEQLEAMLPYYKKVELLVGDYVNKHLVGKPKYSMETLNQESFDFLRNGIRYLCYVDIYNEREGSFDIIEVKAITTTSVLSLGPDIKKVKHPIFIKDKDGIYRLIEETDFIDEEMGEEKYLANRAHLFDKYHSFGHYVYDLAVQRYIIEHDLKDHGKNIDDIKYYLGILNGKYVYDGYKENGEEIYNVDSLGNEIVSLIDLTNITKEYMTKIGQDFNRVEEYINNLDESEYPLGVYCSYKKPTMCRFKPICFKKIPEKNSVLAYLGVKKIKGLTKFELINENIVSMLDIKEEDLVNEKNKIQRDCVLNNKEYADKEKIRAGLNQLEYPIYHLDFETFPCPLPRYEKETCYRQSVFQFSLHIERSPGICDKEKDHFGYLAKDNVRDYRKEIGKALCEYIDIDSGGTVLAHNVSFERGRLKELSMLFDDDPDMKRKLQKMSSKEHSFDTLYLVNNNKELYKDLGMDNIDLFNYYHPNLNGSYSIKKVLPVFSNLSYKDLEVKNGTEALVTYSMFNKMPKEEYDEKYSALIEYCKQDTWAMVEILNGLRKLVK